MSKTRSPMAIVGPIIGFILVYLIIRYGVTAFQADMKLLDEFGVATIQEVQRTGGPEMEEALAEETQADVTQTEETLTEEAQAEETQAEETVDEVVAEEEDAQAEVTQSEASQAEGAIEEAAAEEEESSSN